MFMLKILLLRAVNTIYLCFQRVRTEMYALLPVKRWIDDTQAVAATEAALIFPVLLTMLLGSFDAGYGILAAQKTVRASQVTADLIARHRQVTNVDLDDAIAGGMLSMTPYDTNSYGVDITSIEFDEDSDVVELWCETRNMSRNVDVLNNLGALATPQEGVVVVTVRYNYVPVFSGFVFDEIQMQEVAYVRGRLTSTVPHAMRDGC